MQGKVHALLSRIVGSLALAGARVTAVATEGPGHAAELAREGAASGADLVVVAGGDGAINETVNGLARSRIPLAVLPFGTANVLATELGLPRNPGRAARLIPDMVPERVSVGLLRTAEGTGRYFLLMAGIGLDAHIVLNVDLALKKQIGKLAYWIGGFGKLGQQFPQFGVRINGNVFQSGFALASRVRNYGGDLEIARTASLLENDFEIVSFEGEDSFRYLKYLTGAVGNFLHKLEGVSIHNVREVEFTPPPGVDVFVQVDGELAGKLPAKVEIVEDALTLLAPAAFRERYQRRRRACAAVEA
ncbi:MAG: diacylglycerol kinase family lipid kinase [Bryobacteraceae bacterium]|nr:diacylglycerol kinase family lipid kinase [Bryobacteraceae bacterium]